MESYRIIGTKLEPPLTSNPVVYRKRLAPPADWMSGRYRLATVTGPAGYGKSTLMAGWHALLRAQGIAAAWLSVDADDEDPARFARYLVACLHHALPDVGAAAAAQLESGALPSFQPVLESLLADLEASGKPVCVFLDDFHLAAAAQPLEMLRRLIAYAPGHAVFVIGSRSKLRLNLRELQIKGKALEITMAELRFSQAEARILLQTLSGASLDPGALERLCQRTEGWPAALQLASLSLQGGEDVESLVEDFAGSDRQVCDYLSEVVLFQLPAALRDFLLRTSVLERFCADLCRAVTGCADSQALLEELEARSLFLIPLDRKREWYRYHHLFGDFLQQRLKSAGPGAPAALRERAARWFRAHGLEEEAIHHALEAGDYERAARWIAECAEAVVQRRGAHTTLLRWMQRLPEEVIARWPAIRTHRAWSLSFNRCFAQAERELQKVEAYRRQLPPQAFAEAADIDCMVQLQRCVNAGLRDRADESRRLSEAWLKAWPRANPFLRGAAHVVLGFACKCRCDFEQGLHNLRAARRAFEQSDGHYGMAWAAMVTTVLLAKQGRHRDAMEECERALSLIRRRLGPHAHAVHMLTALMAGMHYERDELAEAEICLRPGLAYVREQGSVDPLLAGYQTLARLERHRGSGERARAVLEEGVALGEERNLPRLVAALQAELATAQLREGETTLASKTLRAGIAYWREHMAADLPPEESAPWGLVRVRHDISRSKAHEALAGLHKLLARARRFGQARRLVELLVLRALALRQLGAEREALRSLEEALTLATPAGHLRVFLDEGKPLRALVEPLLERAACAGPDPAREHLLRLARACGAGVAAAETPRAEARPCSLEPLTSREMQILRMLADGRSNDEMAGLLLVSHGTVKWHLHNIFSKLQVRSRTAALARGRRLQLLD